MARSDVQGRGRELEELWREEMKEWAKIIEELDDDAFDQVIGAFKTTEFFKEVVPEFKDRRRLLRSVL